MTPALERRPPRSGKRRADRCDGRRRHLGRGYTSCAARRLPRARHPGQQQRRPAAGRYQGWDRDEWTGALDANMIAPLRMIRAVLDGMVDRRFGRIVNITSAMVKTPLAPMGLSTGARAGLTSALQGALPTSRLGERNDQQPAAGAHRHAPPDVHGRADRRHRRDQRGGGLR